MLFVSSMPVSAHESRLGYSRSQVCSQIIYKEEYIPGTPVTPGYVKSWKESIQVPCYRTSMQRNYLRHRHIISRSHTQVHKCNSGRTMTGGLLGGGLAAALSEKNAYGWSVPLGAVLGMGVANSDC